MPVLLPARYRYLHDYCVFLHDSFLALVLAAMRANLFSIRLPLLSETHKAELQALDGEELYNWIESTLGEDFSRRLDYRMVMRALASDFSLYTLEALKTSKRGKLAVAYTLLRKPIQDNLFYLEWMLADRRDFLDRFRGASAEALLIKRLSVERRKEIIAVASKRAGGKADLVVDFLYDMRFSKTAQASLARSGDEALHLITAAKHIATRPRNFNFIFSGPEEIESQWKNLYYILPYILYHAVYVLEALVTRIGAFEASYLTTVHVRRDLGLSLAAVLLEPTKKPEIDAWRRTLSEIDPRCSKCTHSLPLHMRNMRSLALRGTLRCTHCGGVEELTVARRASRTKEKGVITRMYRKRR